MTVALTDRKKNPLINNKRNAPLAKSIKQQQKENKKKKTVSQRMKKKKEKSKLRFICFHSEISIK